MNIPVISVKFVDQRGCNVCRLFVDIKLTPPTKNSYYLHLVTGNEGQVVVTDEECREIIERENREHPMDYSGRYEDIETVAIIVNSEESLLRRLDHVRKRSPSMFDKLSGMMKGMTNGLYAPASFTGGVADFLGNVICLHRTN